MSLVSKIVLFFKIMAKNGGPIGLVSKIWRMDAAKEGTFMGTDCFGNKFYENKRYMIGRSRWVEFNPVVKFEYDATQVTPEWYGWLHYRTDKTPCEDCVKLCVHSCYWSQFWLAPHRENLTGTFCAYYPYSTTKCHISCWDGSSICNRPLIDD